jgi:hypothetical protein
MHRGNQQRNLDNLSSRWHAPDMLFARAQTAKDMLQPKVSILLGQPPAHALKVLAFFMQIQQMLTKSELNLDDVVVNFGDHIIMMASKFTMLSNSQLQGRYGPFLKLYKATKSSERIRRFQDGVDAYFDQQFWECEASVCSNENVQVTRKRSTRSSARPDQNGSI